MNWFWAIYSSLVRSTITTFAIVVVYSAAISPTVHAATYTWTRVSSGGAGAPAAIGRVA